VFLQQLDHALGDAHESRRRLGAFGQRRNVGIEENDQVDVAGIIQLTRLVTG
jgi:hypothetical protein